MSLDETYQMLVESQSRLIDELNESIRQLIRENAEKENLINELLRGGS